MSKHANPFEVKAERLSALVDGESRVSEASLTFAQVHEDGELGRAWHAYHLIGDVLRSEDLACDPGHDLDFVVALRKRMAHEPVKLLPAHSIDSQPSSVGSQRLKRPRPLKRFSAGMAAGFFVALVPILAVTQLRHDHWFSSETAADRLVAQVQAVPMSGASASSIQNAASAEILESQLIHDARLEEYFAAHKKFGGSFVLGRRSAVVRNAADEER